jgi:hypothetical protein
MLLLSGDFPIATNPFPSAVGVWFHYTQGEVLDGPGKGLDPFKPELRAGIKSFVDGTCVAEDYAILKGLASEPAKLYTQEFNDAVALTAALGGDCPTDKGDVVKALCEKWMARYKAARPRLTNAVPILVTYGDKDDTIAPERAKCAFDRFRADGANWSLCVAKDANHNGILLSKIDHSIDWIASQTLGEPAPAACEADESAVLKDGAPATCATPPPND